MAGCPVCTLSNSFSKSLLSNTVWKERLEEGGGEEDEEELK